MQDLSALIRPKPLVRANNGPYPKKDESTLAVFSVRLNKSTPNVSTLMVDKAVGNWFEFLIFYVFG
jgi:hypothetical protein